MSLPRGTATENPKGRTSRTRPTLEVLEHRLLLSTFRVNSTLDTVAVNFKNGKDASGHISLRSAIMTADTRGGSNTIIVPSGMFTLTISGANENASATGDLDISRNVTIKGSGGTVIDGNNLDRVFQVLSGKVTFQNLTIQHGRAAQGAGILNTGGNVTLTSVQVINNVAIGANGLNGVDGAGGGVVGGDGTAGTAGGTAEGGGIFNAAGSLTINKSNISGNEALGGTGGNGGSGGFGAGAIGAAGQPGQTGTGGKGGAGGAGGAAFGGGIANLASLTMNATTLAQNIAVGGAGGRGGNGGLGAGGNGGADEGAGGGIGGAGFGGAGGSGGSGGNSQGGGLFNLGATSFSGNSSTVTLNRATSGLGGTGGNGGTGIGARGANGILINAGKNGGLGDGGFGATGGAAGTAQGGGIFNGATLTSTTGVAITNNIAAGNTGGNSGAAGAGVAFQGGNGGPGLFIIPPGNGGTGGTALGSDSSLGGQGGTAAGGGLFNAAGGTVSFKPLKNKNTPASTFAGNVAVGGNGGAGGRGGNADGGNGGSGSVGGNGGTALAGTGGQGGSAGSASGGGLDNNGTASFTGIAVTWIANRAQSGNGGAGGAGGTANGGAGAATNGKGGNASGGKGGDGGLSSFGIGGGIHNANTTLVINPRLGARKGSKATDTITTNQALAGTGGAVGAGGTATAGPGGAPAGVAGTATVGVNGTAHPLSVGAGGGIFTAATATVDFTTIAGNVASSQDPDVDGTIVT